MGEANDTIHLMRDAIDAVTRYATRGCSGMACDRAREAMDRKSPRRAGPRGCAGQTGAAERISRGAMG